MNSIIAQLSAMQIHCPIKRQLLHRFYYNHVYKQLIQNLAHPKRNKQSMNNRM